jgi:hypothetical protein
MVAMQRTSRLFCLVGLAGLSMWWFAVGCGRHQSPAPVTPAVSGALPIPDGPGCPQAASAMVAVYHEPVGGLAATWNLPLANRASLGTSPSYQLLDASAATAAGIPAVAAKLWLLQAGAAPCEATPGAWYADTVVDGPANDVLGVQLVTKCAAPSKEQPQQAIAVVSEIAPTGCVPILPRPVAGRVGEPQGSSWQVLPQSTPMPASVEAAMPQKPCTAPCEKLWTVAQIDFAGKPVAWDVAVEWLRVDRTQSDVCQWASEGDGGVLVAASSGAAERLVHEHSVEPLHLAAVLADRAGPKVIVLEHIGEYATFDLGGGAPIMARHLRWYVPNEELYAGDRKLGPYCGP